MYSKNARSTIYVALLVLLIQFPLLVNIPSSSINNFSLAETRSRNLNFSPAALPKSVVRFLIDEGKTVSVVLGNEESISVINAGNSTLIRPSAELGKKIDSSLLNLTKLVADHNLEDNRTRIILSGSNIMAENVQHKKIVETIYRINMNGGTPDRPQLYAADMEYSSIFELARDPNVDYIWLDRKVRICLDESIDIIKDSVEWSNVESAFDRQINGSGVRIAVLDTGIDSSHPDFSFPNGTSKIVGAVSFTGESVADRSGHGTHCASIAAGTGEAASRKYVGVAPGASLLNVKVLNNQGEGLESWVINGIHWAVDNGADVLSMSLGVETDSNGSDPMSMTVDWAIEQGVIVVVAAGNLGAQKYTIVSPGTARQSITVGASTKQDTIATFSSRGPTIDYRVKPDILAPGVNIIAARAGETSMGTPVSTYYTKASGTSMATPHVAGAAALLLDAYPHWTPRTIKSTLANYANPIGSNVLAQGSGRVNICRSANTSITGNSSVSIGRVHFNTINDQMIVLENLATSPILITTAAETWLIENQVSYDVVSLNASTIFLSSGQSRVVRLRLNVSLDLPTGYFEGRLNATFEGQSIGIPFFYCILSQLECGVVNENGSKIKAAFAVIDAESGKAIDYAWESINARFVLTPGEYIVQAMDVYGLQASGGIDVTYSFLIHQEASLGKDETKYVNFSLASAHKLSLRSTNLAGSFLHIKLKQLLSPHYYIAYLSDIGPIVEQTLYLTNLSEYMIPPCYYGFMGFSPEDIYYQESGSLTTEVDAFFIGWDISDFSPSPYSNTLSFQDSELATFSIDNLYPTYSDETTMWFNQIAGLWQTGLWQGYETHPGIRWKTHILPYQYRNPSSASWAEMEWSCIYSLSPNPESFNEYFVVDRHFQPIEKGESSSYVMGKTPLLPQPVHNSSSYYGEGLLIPHYPLLAQNGLYLNKDDSQATKRVEVLKDGLLVYNQTKLWAQEPILISDVLATLGYGLYCFTVTADTNMDLSSKNTAKYEINYASMTTDLIPPTLMEINAPTCFTTNTYPVKVNVVDNNQLEIVSIYYSLDNGDWLPASAVDLGNNTYSTNISLQTITQQVSLSIEAVDTNGNTILFVTGPAAERGLETEILATMDDGLITGKLMIIGGHLIQPIYLKIKTTEDTLYALVDINGDFEFNLPQPPTLPVEIEFGSMGPYASSALKLEKIESHDLALIEIVSSKTITNAYVRINVTISNEGSFAETFDIAISANATIIHTTTTSLNISECATVTYMWDTTDSEKGNYMIGAYIWPVVGENDTMDNDLTDGWICLTITGDVDGDFDVDIFDVVKVSIAYQSYIGDPQYDANCDIDDDGDVDIFDVVIAAINYGEQYHPSWYS